MGRSAPGFKDHPAYRVDIVPTTDHVRVLVGDRVIADSRHALKVIESRHHPVWYLPLADLDLTLVEPSTHSTYCPFKGHASYWSIASGGNRLENCIWSYQEPYQECAPLQDHVAFYTDRVTFELNGEKQTPQAPGWSE